MKTLSSSWLGVLKCQQGRHPLLLLSSASHMLQGPLIALHPGRGGGTTAGPVGLWAAGPWRPMSSLLGQGEYY